MIGWILRAFGWLGGWIITLGLIFFLYNMIVEYTPSEVEQIAVSGEAQPIKNDTINIVSWNIGYAGLGSDMDFFMDGGQSVQCSQGRTQQNLSAIISFLKDSCADADFILLQEVDRNSKRSYGLNEYDSLVRHLGDRYRAYYAANFKVSFVPIPLSNPIGDVDAGLVTLSRYTPSKVVRLSYPNGTSWPQRMFDLKRCLLGLEVSLGDSSVIHINNTHNSAYDDGGQRTAEIVYLNSYLSSNEPSVTAGDWNSNPPLYSPSAAEQKDQHFRPMRLKAGDFPSGYHIAADLTRPSARYGYEPYDSTTTTCTVIDFAVSSPRVVPISVRTIDLGFENSDHNPVVYKFIIK